MRGTFKLLIGTALPAMCAGGLHAQEPTTETVEVIATRFNEARNGILPETGSSIYRISNEDIAEMPTGEYTPLNQVLLRAPGVSQDSFGQLHVRGDHANLQYRINGVIIPESISGFGQSLDPRFFSGVNFLTGALPAQYGYRTAGIVDIQTKSGALNPGGSVGVLGGSYSTVNPIVEYGGTSGRLDYYVTAQYLHSSVGIENPTPSRDAIHDDTNQWKGFGYMSSPVSETARLSGFVGSVVSHFQIPNQPGVPPAYSIDGSPTATPFDSTLLDENQREETQYGVVALQGKGGTAIDYQLALFTRYTQTHFLPDQQGDIVFNGIASDVYRSNFANGLQGDGSYRLNAAHTLRAGVFLSREKAVSNNSSAVLLSGTGGPGGNQAAGAGPVNVIDNSAIDGSLYGLYLQDEWRATENFIVNYGGRFDHVSAYVNESQLSPRIGVVYEAGGTTIHGGYAHYFTPPPTELVAPKDIALFEGTVNSPEALGNSTLNDPVRSEQSNYFDIGVSQQVTAEWTIGLDGYYKQAHHLLDEGQFGAALVFSPFNYEKGKVYGVELTNGYRKGPLSAYLNVAWSMAMGTKIESAQFNFSQDDLNYIATHYINLDHDQRISASGGVSYLWQKTTFTADFLLGSGLRRTSDNGVPNGDHLPSYATVNLSASRPFQMWGIGGLVGRVSVLNLFDKTYEIRDGTGVGVGAPQFGMRRAIYVALNKTF